MDYERIEKATKDLLLYVNDTNVAAVDIIGVAKKLGFIVVNAELDADEDGFIIVDERGHQIMGLDTNKLIGVRSDQSVEWKRFVIAHEIGHFMMHYNNASDNGLYAHREHKTGKNDTENEADFFAANILMPRDRFAKHYNDLLNMGLSKEELVLLISKRFGVTEKMAIRRFEELGLDAR